MWINLLRNETEWFIVKILMRANLTPTLTLTIFYPLYYPQSAFYRRPLQFSQQSLRISLRISLEVPK